MVIYRYLLNKSILSSLHLPQSNLGSLNLTWNIALPLRHIFPLPSHLWIGITVTTVTQCICVHPLNINNLMSELHGCCVVIHRWIIWYSGSVLVSYIWRKKFFFQAGSCFFVEGSYLVESYNQSNIWRWSQNYTWKYIAQFPI